MKKYEELEQAILDCIICNPELMKDNKLNDKYFKTNKRLWLFLKACYERFGTFDIALMASVCPNASDMIDYIADVIDGGHHVARFNLYQERLIEMYEDEEIIEKIYILSRKLYAGVIKLEDFKKGIKEFISDEEQNQ